MREFGKAELSYKEIAARLGISEEKLIRKMAAMIGAWCYAVEDVQDGRGPSIFERGIRFITLEL